jgi:hypothetical protein
MFRNLCAVLVAAVMVGCASTSRTVRRTELRSRGLPAVTIHVRPAFRYLGRFSFVLGNDFEGERYVFAEAKGKVLQRLLIVQFERVRPASSEVYRYSFEKAERIGSLQFIQNSFAFPGARDIKAAPKDEGEMTSNFLLAHGFRSPDLWLAARFVTLGAADRKSEMIVFYMERNDQLRLSDLYAGDEPTAVWSRMKPEVVARARAAFALSW